MRTSVTGAVLLLALAVAGCSAFKGRKPEQPEQVIDPNVYPANYRAQIAGFLQTELTDRADFHGASIAQPAMKPTGDSQHYVVCVQLNGHNQHRDKVAIYLGGNMTQFIDAQPQQCGDAAYQPFVELDRLTPSR